MASIWSQAAGSKKASKMAGRLDPKEAQRAFSRIVESWGGPVKRVGRWDVLFYESAEAENPSGSMWVEFHSPPSKPGPGETYHVTLEPA